MTIIHIPKRIKTTKIAHMLIYDVVCCYYDKYTKSVQSYRGENALYMFIKGMLELEFKYRRNIIKYKFNKLLKMTPDDEKDLKQVE